MNAHNEQQSAAAQEAVAEVVRPHVPESMTHGEAASLRPRVQMLAPMPPVGTKLYAAPVTAAPSGSLSPLARIADAFGVTGTWDQIADAVIARSTPAAPGIDLREFGVALIYAVDVLRSAGGRANTIAADKMALLIELIDASPKGGSDEAGIPEPHQECYSDNDGDSWYDHPADAELVTGLAVGETYTLTVSHYSVERTYRVTKVPDDLSDDYEVEPVRATSAQAQAGDAEVQP